MASFLDQQYSQTANVKPSGDKQSLGDRVGDFLGFDITPGFNLTTSRGSGIPFVERTAKSIAPTSTTAPADNTYDTTDASALDQYSGTFDDGSGSGTDRDDIYALGQLEDQERLLRGILSRITTQEPQGFKTIEDDYTDKSNRANTARERALRDFGTQTTDTQRAKDSAVDRVDTNARTLNNSLRRMLGMASGSGSSAYKFAAPNAVARLASGERTGVMEDYGTNFRNIDTASKDAEKDFGTLLADLAKQRSTARMNYEQGLGDKGIEVQGKLADIARQRTAIQGGSMDAIRAASAPYMADIDSRNASLDSLFDKYRTPITTRDINVQTPELRDYTVDRAAINSNKSAGTSQYSPYAQLLKKDEDEERLG